MATIPASENVYPIVRFAEAAAPATPPTGEVHLYALSTGVLAWKDDAGTVYPLGDAIAHLADASAAHGASAISFSPTGTIAATDVQAAIAEVASEAAGGVTDLDDLADVDTTGVADGDVLTFDSGSGDWIAGTPSGGSAGDAALVTEATQNVAHNTLTKLTFGTEAYDDAAFHSGGSPGRLTAPATGRYRVGFAAHFGFAVSNELDFLVQLNGTTGVASAIAGDTTANATAKYRTLMFDCALTSGDFLEIECYHDNGSTRAVTKARFSIQRID